MTRRDYLLLSSTIKGALAARKMSTQERWGAEHVARTLAYTLQAQNPRFDAQRFLTDCGVGRAHVA